MTGWTNSGIMGVKLKSQRDHTGVPNADLKERAMRIITVPIYTPVTVSAQQKPR
jgi:hypothetical protein